MMVTIKMRSRVDNDGILRLEVPVDAAGSEVDIVLNMQPVENESNREDWHAFIERMAGSLADDPIERPPQGDYEEREPIE